MRPVIRAEGLVKNYREVTALDGLDLEVAEGKVLGLLGPNGAGKTTAVRILTTLLVPDGGRAEVAGVELTADPDGVRSRIGLSGQYAAVDEHLTGFENLEMIGRLYRLGRTRSRERARELLDRFDLSEAGDRPVKTYSGGMRRRLDLAGALVAKPAVLFLDEPTTGLDPRSRASMWEIIRELVESGTTLLLTTQYLEEADRLADDIVVIDHGRVIARGDARKLKREVGGDHIGVTLADADDLAAATAILARVCGSDPMTDHSDLTVTVPTTEGVAGLASVANALADAAIAVEDLSLRQPTLDEVFLTLTGEKTDPDESQSRP